MGEHVKYAEDKVLFDFKDPSTLKQFVSLSDNDIGGISRSQLLPSKHGRGLFTGTLSTHVPDGSGIDYSGFAAIRSKPIVGLFNQVEIIDLSIYDCIEIKYRGDGRPYFINVQTKSMVNTNDVYQAFLFSKGGPHWEVERIPFTKFLMTYHGYLQDVQIDFLNIRTMGISINDKKSGDFSLEIEYIKLVQLFHQPIIFEHQRRKRSVIDPGPPTVDY